MYKLKTLTFVMLVLTTVPLAAGEQTLVDYSKPLIVAAFDAGEIKGAAALPEATRSAVIAVLNDEQLFPSITAADEKKTDGEKPVALRLTGKLVDFYPGNAGKRLMIGFGSGRANATFEFTITDSASGSVVWQKKVKHTASFWFNSTTSSAAERSELPEGIAKKLVAELKKR